MNQIFTYLMKRKGQVTWHFSLLLFLSLGTSLRVAAQTFVHPGVPFTRADLDQLKANITREPWLTGYNALKADSHSQLSYKVNPPQPTVTRAPNLNNAQWLEDMVAVHNLAFMYVFTGDSAYARKATNLLDGWAITNTTWGGGENMLDIGDKSPYFVAGADILRSTFPGWSAANDQHVNNYFRNVLYPASWVPGPLRDHNKGAIQLEIAVGIAAYLSDSVMMQQAVEVYRMDAGGGLRNSLLNGEVGDSGRDDHWFAQVQALGWSAEVAWKQGIDLFAELDNRLLAIGELYNRYSQAPATVSFIPFGGYSAYYTNWGIPPGMIHQSPFNNIIKSAYSLRKGIADPYTEQIRTLAGEGSWSFLYLKSSDTSHAAALTPIIYPADLAHPVSQLSNADIGSTGISGSMVNNSGTWTIKGAGSSAASACNFSFKPVKGNVGMIIKVTSNSLTTGGTGIMIRQSLSSTANFVAVNLGNNGGVSSSGKGNTAATSGTHGQPKAPWWLKLERVGDRIFTYHSQDGVNWTNNALYIITLPDNAYIGCYTYSNNTSALNIATVTNVAVNNTAPTGSPEITSNMLSTGALGASFNYNIIASGSPSVFRATGLPVGLQIDSLSGLISGTPSVVGQSQVNLQAVNATGVGVATLIINITNNATPAIPANIIAAVSNISSIKINWPIIPNADHYTVKRSTSPAGPFTSIQDNIITNSFIDAAPVPEVNNYYVVTASAGALESGKSNVVFAAVPPSAPAQITVINKNKEIDLSWAPASGAATYNIKRGSLSGGPYTTLANIAGTSYADLNVTNGTPRYYVISSVGQTKESANSPEVIGVPGAASYTWTAIAETDSLNFAANWMEKSVPVNPAIITFPASADTLLTNDIRGLVTSQIQFNADANNYTISGDTLRLRNDLINNAGTTQTLNTPVVLDTLLNVNAVGTNGTITIPKSVTGSGSLLKTGIGFLYLTGNNTYSGGTTLNGAGQSWPPVSGIELGGLGSGSPSAPLSGPLGTGKILMNGGALITPVDATLYNDIEVIAGKTSYIYQTNGALNLRGKLTGSGTIIQDGNVFAGLHLFADNSGFTGTFISKLRSGNSRTRFEVPESGSAKAFWNLDASGNDCQSLQFPIGTISFGGLTGRGAIRTDGGGAPTISIGALNLNSSYDGVMTGTMNIEKIGTGVLIFTGNNNYTGVTTVKSGKLLLNNSATSGVFTSPVIVNAGSFGGTGKSTASLTIGSGTGTGAILEPGNQAVGALIAGALTLNSDATYNVDLNLSNATGDKISSASVALNSPQINLTAIAGTLPMGTNFTIIDNIGTSPITGTFRNQPENSLISAGGYSFLVTYKGGTGNDVLLLDERTQPMTITSGLLDTAVSGKNYTYIIKSSKSPNAFSATGLPAGWHIDATTGTITGTAPAPGTYSINITASNGTNTVTGTLSLTIQSNLISGLLAAGGDAKSLLEWNPIARMGYNIKRSASAGGPYTTVGNVTINKFTDNNVVTGNSYYYVIAVMDTTGEGPQSAEVIAKPNSGQVDYYSFDETSGIRAVDSWGLKHATLMATATHGSGKYGQALKLDGTSTSYSTLPAGIISGLSDFTISTWVKMDAIATWMRVFDFGNGTTQFMYLSVQVAVSGGKSTVRYSIRNIVSGEQQVNFNYAFPLNTWVNMAVTRLGNTCTLYINGAAVASNTAVTYKPSDLGITTLNYLGKSQSNDPLLKGSIDDFKIYNRALSPAELASSILGDQSVSFTPLPHKMVGDADFDPQATASSGLPVIYSSSDTTVASVVSGNLHIKMAGITLIAAEQPGDANYKAAVTVNQLLTVSKKDQVISFAGITQRNVNDPDFDPLATASSGLPVTYSSSDTTVANIVNGKIHMIGAGTATISAVQAGDIVYNAAAGVDQLLTVNKLTQTIVFNTIPGKKAGDADVMLSASASSGLPIFFSSADPNVAVINNGLLHITGTGSVTITATQPGNNSYQPISATQTFIVSKINLQVQYLDGDNSQIANNTARPYLKLANLDSVSVNYDEISIRYWFTAENFTGLNTWVDYAQVGSGIVKMKYVALGQPRAGAYGYIEYSFNSTASLSPNSNSGPIQSRFANVDWSNLNELDDFSYKSPTGSYVINDHMTIYRNGVLIAGIEPASVVPATSFTVNYQNQNSSATGNSISTFLSVNNTGNLPVSYGDLKVRYWFTSEGSQSLNFWKDYVKMGSNNITGGFVKINPGRNGADSYLELQFNSAAGTLYPLSNTGNVQYRITKSDWSAFNEANDFSYALKTAMAENNHITVYYKGQLIYGTEPAALTTNTLAWDDHSKNVLDLLSGAEIEKPLIYPNPLNTSNFSIKLTKDLINKTVVVKITDPYGKLIQAKNFGNNTGEVIQLSLPAGGLPGVYIVQLNDLQTLKLLVVR